MSTPHEVILFGYSDDCHNCVVDGVRESERYSPFVVRVAVRGVELTATMRYRARGGGWECVISAPPETQITIGREDEP